MFFGDNHSRRKRSNLGNGFYRNVVDTYLDRKQAVLDAIDYKGGGIAGVRSHIGDLFADPMLGDNAPLRHIDNRHRSAPLVTNQEPIAVWNQRRRASYLRRQPLSMLIRRKAPAQRPAIARRNRRKQDCTDEYF